MIALHLARMRMDQGKMAAHHQWSIYIPSSVSYVCHYECLACRCSPDFVPQN